MIRYRYNCGKIILMSGLNSRHKIGGLLSTRIKEWVQVYNVLYGENIDGGVQVASNTIEGYISIYWYIGSVLTWALYGVVSEFIKYQIKRIKDKYRHSSKNKCQIL